MPKLASLPHASPTNVTFMSSFSHGPPPPPSPPLPNTHSLSPRFSARLSYNCLQTGGARPPTLACLACTIFPTSRLHLLDGLVVISSTSWLRERELFLAPLFLMFALSGIHFMSIYGWITENRREYYTLILKGDLYLKMKISQRQLRWQ